MPYHFQGLKDLQEKINKIKYLCLGGPNHIQDKFLKTDQTSDLREKFILE